MRIPGVASISRTLQGMLFHFTADASEFLASCSFLLDWFEDFEATHQGLIDRHHGSSIVELAAVVRSAEECDELPLSKEFISIFHHLVSPTYQVHVMLLQEAGHHIRAEDEGDATVVLCPASDVFVGVCPEKIADHPGVGHIRRAHQAPHLVEVADLRRQTTMHAHDLLIDKSADRHAVEDVTELFPKLDVVTPLALIVEPIDSGDGCTFVVASQEEEILWVLCLVCKQQDDGLQALLATIDVVTKEEVIALRRKPTILEKTKEVVVLAMDITADLQRCLQFQQRILIKKDATNCCAECFHLRLWNLDQLPRLATLGFEALIDDLVHLEPFSLLHASK